MPGKRNETIVNLARLNALNDGVYAIALTILVLDIRVTENTLAGELSATLVGLAPRLLVYLISFVVIGGAWGSHQRMMSQIGRGDGPLVWFNLLWLLFVTLVPASAALLGRFPDEIVAIGCFAAVVILIQLSALWLWRHASKNGLLKASLDPRVVRAVGRRLILSAVFFALAVALIVFNAYLVYAGWIGLFVLLFITDWLSWQQVVKTTRVAVPLDGAERGHIKVLHGAGHLKIRDDATDMALVEGTCRGDVDSQVMREGNLLTARLALHSGRGFLSRQYPWAWDIPEFNWNLSLNPDLPLALHIEKATGEVDLDFTNTHLTELRLETGYSSIGLRLPARAGQTAVYIESGTGSLAIHVPAGMAAWVRGSTGRGRFEVDPNRFPPVTGRKVKDEEEYCSSDYDTATNRVEIHLQLGLGSVKIT